MKYHSIALGLLCLASFQATASISIPTNTQNIEFNIHPKHLPLNVHSYIGNRYKGAEIIEVHKLESGDYKDGFRIKIKFRSKIMFLTFDKLGKFIEEHKP